MTAASDARISLAIAARAYAGDVVRLADPHFAGCAHLVASRDGLFAVAPGGAHRVAYGRFYGLTVRGDAILAFEACDRPRHPTRRGRIVRLRHDGTRIVAADVIATGLDNGCHQIDLIDGRLCVVDTYNQRILRYPAQGGGEPEALYPLGAAPVGERAWGERAWGAGYAHANSLLAAGGERLLLLDHGAERTGRRSEIARFDAGWRPLGRVPLDGLGCHGLARLEDGAILACGSSAGELVSTAGLKVRVCDLMTRGLSVDAATIVVGGSAFAARDRRDAAAGAVFFLDRGYRRLAAVPLPAQPTEIRRIDGRDRSLSAYLAALDQGDGRCAP